jgi:hypothetical protein
MKRNSQIKKGMLLLVPFLFLLAACNTNVGFTLKHYAQKPGFDLKIIRSDSLSEGPKGLSKMLRYLDGIQQVYVLTFDADSGNIRENEALFHHLKQKIADQHFENLISVGGKSQLGLYAQKDENGEVSQMLFLKSGGRHSLYVWAPKNKPTP